MPRFTVTWLGRDKSGQYTREHEIIPADSVREVEDSSRESSVRSGFDNRIRKVESFIRHGARNGKWVIEGDIHVRCNRLNIDTWVKA